MQVMSLTKEWMYGFAIGPIGKGAKDKGTQKTTARTEKGEAMTLDELKAEAKRQGYKLIKDNPMPKLLPCICGSKHRTLWLGVDGWLFKCDGCGRTAKPGRTERKAREEWNRMVNDEK